MTRNDGDNKVHDSRMCYVMAMVTSCGSVVIV